MKTFKQYINEIFDERIDSQIAQKKAKYSEEQLNKHKKLLSVLKVAMTDPRMLKLNQQIKNRQRTQERLSKRA